MKIIIIIIIIIITNNKYITCKEILHSENCSIPLTSLRFAVEEEPYKKMQTNSFIEESKFHFCINK